MTPKTKELKIKLSDMGRIQYEYSVIPDVVGDCVVIILQSYQYGWKETTLKQKTMRIPKEQFIRETKKFLAAIKTNEDIDKMWIKA